MNARYTIIVAVAALVVGALLGYYIPQSLAKVPETEGTEANEQLEDGKRSARPRSKSTHEADLNRLRTRIEQLEGENNTLRQELAQHNDVAEEPVDQPATNRVEASHHFRPFGPPPSAAQMRARFEEMREKDPERYAQITNNMARWRAHRQKRLKNQFDILADADTEHMTKSERKVHEDYRNLLARQEELHELLNPNNGDITDEQRDEAMMELRDNRSRLHELQRAERDTLLTLTANGLGYEGDDAKEVVDAIKAVYEATGGGRHHGPPGGGPGGPPGGGWGRR